jgi:hypothetical protein
MMTLTVRSDTLSLMADPSAQAMQRAAATATLDARAAWKMAGSSPDETNVRAAFRQCVLAARIVRRAADAEPTDDDERRRMIEGAERIETAADDLKARLARIVEGSPEADVEVVDPDAGSNLEKIDR